MHFYNGMKSNSIIGFRLKTARVLVVLWLAILVCLSDENVSATKLKHSLP